MILSEAGKVGARLRSRWRHYQDARALEPLYSPDPTDVDLDRHLAEALAWIRRAQDSGTDRGVAYGARFGGEFTESYPETTGYIIQTFVEQYLITGDADFLNRAIEMGDWEIAIQMESGAVRGGRMSADAPTPALFNTGMVLLGWCALVQATGCDRYKEAARRAAEWLTDIQEPNGDWIKGHSQFTMPGPGLYRVKVAWGLCEAGVVLGEPRYLDAGLRNALFCMAQQHRNGWFPQCCLSDPKRPLLHTLAYTMQGLVNIGRIMEREDVIRSAGLLADAEIRLMGPDGFLPGRQNASLKGTTRWCCLTGTAQTSIVWSELFALTGESRYQHAARRANQYLMRHHDIRNPDDRLRGGLPGSWPTSGGYRRLEVINWGTKFFIDALSREKVGPTPIVKVPNVQRMAVAH